MSLPGFSRVSTSITDYFVLQTAKQKMNVLTISDMVDAGNYRSQRATSLAYTCLSKQNITFCNIFRRLRVVPRLNLVVARMFNTHIERTRQSD